MKPTGPNSPRLSDTPFEKLSVRSQNVLRQLSKEEGMPIEALFFQHVITSERLRKVRNCGQKSIDEILTQIKNPTPIESVIPIQRSMERSQAFESTFKSLIGPAFNELSMRSQARIKSICFGPHALDFFSRSTELIVSDLDQIAHLGSKSIREIIRWSVALLERTEEIVASQQTTAFVPLPKELLREVTFFFPSVEKEFQMSNSSGSSALKTILDVLDPEDHTRKIIESNLRCEYSQTEFALRWLGCIVRMSQKLSPQLNKKWNISWIQDVVFLVEGRNTIERSLLEKQFRLGKERIRQRRNFWLLTTELGELMNKPVVIADHLVFVERESIASFNPRELAAVFRIHGFKGERIWMSDVLIKKCRKEQARTVLEEHFGAALIKHIEHPQFENYATTKRLLFKKNKPSIDEGLAKLKKHLIVLHNPIDKIHLESLIGILFPDHSFEYVFRNALQKRYLLALGRSGTYIANTFKWKSGEITYEGVAEKLLKKFFIISSHQIRREFEELTNTIIADPRSVSSAMGISSSRDKSKLSSLPFDHYILTGRMRFLRKHLVDANHQRISKNGIAIDRIQVQNLISTIERKARALNQPTLCLALHCSSKLDLGKTSDAEKMDVLDHLFHSFKSI